MADRRLLLALGAAALFGVGFGLGWLVRGEHEAPADLGSGASSAATESALDGSAGDGAGGEGADGGAASAAEGGAAGEDGVGGSGTAGEGDVAVVGGGGDESARTEGAGDDAEGAGGEGEGASGPLDGGVRGRLDAAAIQDVVREHRDELGFCFAWQLHQQPDLGGRIVMEFEIGPDGHVAEARVADDALGDEVVLRCFVNVTRRMEFPPPEDGGNVTVRYPFVLAAGEPDGNE